MKKVYRSVSGDVAVISRLDLEGDAGAGMAAAADDPVRRGRGWIARPMLR